MNKVKYNVVCWLVVGLFLLACGNDEKVGKEDSEIASNTLTSTVVDTQYVEVIGHDVNGTKVLLSDVVAQNKFTILEFWASWCKPCRAEIPNLEKAYEQYREHGLEIVSVSLDSKEKSWRKALEEENTSWVNLYLEDDFQSPYAQAYGVSAIPASFLIAKDGKILASSIELRSFELEKTLKTYIRK